MKYLNTAFWVGLTCAAIPIFFLLPCSAFDLVRNGKAVAVIVVPALPLAVETYAAEELQYHVKASTGATLRIIRENSAIPAGGLIHLGACKASQAAGADPAKLEGNGYVLKTSGRKLYVAGKDDPGDPMTFDTHAGTLFGVYAILENNLGVHWLWPGTLGEVIPTKRSLSLPVLNTEINPLLWFKGWRVGLENQWGFGGDPMAFGSQEQYRKYAHDELVWMRRQRFGRSTHIAYGHAFPDWWSRFGEPHPNWFAMLPDGIRGTTSTDPRDFQYVHVCITNPDVMNERIKEWRDQGMPEYFNICQNDGWAGCMCPNCMALDVSNPTDGINFATRFEATKAAFEKNEDEWQLKLGSLSDRYTWFAKRMLSEASKYRPDVKVVTYMYDNYRKPPMKPADLGPNVLAGLVPDAWFPYARTESDSFRHDWGGWAKTGCMLFLRPNYTLQGNNFPVFYARTLGEDLKFAMHHSMKGTDFDSLTGQFSTQGPTLYMMPKMLNYPDALVDGVLDEFYSAFGHAKGAVKEYFDLWDKVYQPYTVTNFKDLMASRRKYGATYDNFFAIAPMIYTPKVMAKGSAILDNARQQAAGDPKSAARVEWLAKGFKHVELELAAEKAYEHAVDTGDDAPLKKVYAELKAFRVKNANECISNFSGLAGIEKNIWGKFLK
jgi:hypothetical protein